MANCPAPKCQTAARSGYFMCRSHWFGTPKPLRDEIWRTWKIVEAGKRGSDRSMEQRLADIRAYRDATQAALDWWAE